MPAFLKPIHKLMGFKFDIYGELFCHVVGIRDGYIFLGNAWFYRNKQHFSERQLLEHVLVQEIQLKISQSEVSVM